MTTKISMSTNWFRGNYWFVNVSLLLLTLASPFFDFFYTDYPLLSLSVFAAATFVFETVLAQRIWTIYRTEKMIEIRLLLLFLTLIGFWIFSMFFLSVKVVWVLDF